VESVLGKKNPVKEYLADIGKAGGNARAAKLSPKERSELARAAVNARWAKRQAKRRADGA